MMNPLMADKGQARRQDVINRGFFAWPCRRASGSVKAGSGAGIRECVMRSLRQIDLRRKCMTKVICGMCWHLYRQRSRDQPKKVTGIIHVRPGLNTCLFKAEAVGLLTKIAACRKRCHVIGSRPGNGTGRSGYRPRKNARPVSPMRNLPTRALRGGKLPRAYRARGWHRT